MHLRAAHSDGFSEHLVLWLLEAADGKAIVEASWFANGERVEQSFEMTFPDSRIQACADALVRLKPEYDGHLDDVPRHQLMVTIGDRQLTTEVSPGFSWPEDDQAAVDLFMSVWRPIDADVEQLLAIPGRSSRRKE